MDVIRKQKKFIEFKEAYALSRGIKILKLEAIAEFCSYDLINYVWDIKKEYQSVEIFSVYGLSIKSIIFPDRNLHIVLIDNSIVDSIDLKKVNANKLILNNCKTNESVPRGIFSKTGIFNVYDKNIKIIDKEDIPLYEEISTNSLDYLESTEFSSLKILNRRIKKDASTSRKRALRFSNIYQYIPKIKIKKLVICLYGKNYDKVIESIISNKSAENFYINSDAENESEESKKVSIQNGITGFTLLSGDKIIYWSEWTEKLWI